MPENTVKASAGVCGPHNDTPAPTLASRLDEAVAALRRVAQRGEGTESLRKLLAKLLLKKGSLHARKSDFGQSAAALHEALSFDRERGQLLGSDVELANMVGVIYLLGGLRAEAVKLWEQVQRVRPFDVCAAHLLLISQLAKAFHAQASGDEGESLLAWQKTFSNAVLLMHEESFAEEVRRHAEERYGQSVNHLQVKQVWQQFEQTLQHWCPSSSPLGLTFDIERSTAQALKKLGGFPLSDQDAEQHVCGLLMLQHLGYSDKLGGFLLRLLQAQGQRSKVIKIRKVPTTGTGAGGFQVMPSAEEVRRLLRYFSCYRKSQVLLDQGFPQLALEALEHPRPDVCATCPVNRNEVEAEWSPHLCQELCDKFPDADPAYADLAEKGYLLWRGGVELAAEAHAALALTLVSSVPPAVEQAFKHWKEALRLSSERERDQVLRTILGTVAGRTQSLVQQGDFDSAVALLETAESFGNLALREELEGLLPEVLNYRGVHTANGDSPDWDAAVSDFSRSVKLNPYDPVPVRNWAYALRQKAIAVHQYHLFEAAQRLIEAHTVLLKGSELLPGEPQLLEEMSTLQYDMQQVSAILEADSYAWGLPGDESRKAEFLTLAADLRERVRASKQLRIKVSEPSGPPAPAPTPRIKILMSAADNSSPAVVRPRASRIRILGD
ncbi:MAG: hypothetical protein ACJ74W_24135 [Pyrinomonadaceae bacterium]